MATVSKEEYLKRYLSSSDGDKKKKRRKKQITKKGSQSRIIDDDVDFNSLLPDNLTNRLDEDIQVAEDEPVIADFIDERPELVQQMESYRKTKQWKTFADGSSNINGKDPAAFEPNNSPPHRNEMHNKHKAHDVSSRQHSDSDQSPPQSKNKQRHDSSSDESPPRRKFRQSHYSESDESPHLKKRRQRHDSDSDQSLPLRKSTQRHDSESEQSSPRRKHRQRHNSGSDQSPPRKNHKYRHDSESDQSPPRKNHKYRHDSESDQSPPRRKSKQSHESDSDQSPPRKKSTRMQEPESDQSPPRRISTRRNVSESDQSPPRRKTGDKATKTLSGASAGLSSAKQMKKEAAAMRKREREQFDKIDEDTSGRNAQTVFRSKQDGRKRNLTEEAKEANIKDKKQKEKDDRYEAWGKGLKQGTDHMSRLEDAMHEMSKPLARYADDTDRDALLKEQEREMDPMLEYMRKKTAKSNSKVKAKPIYRGPEPAPNRYGIRPGYRWDGVDRSNGFEKKLFSSQSEKKSRDSEAYKWSTEDM